MFYTGIGSRQTPYDIQCAMYVLGKFLAKKSFVLRSGGDNAAAAAFEMGCDLADGKKEIYLDEGAFTADVRLAKQLLGADLNTPSSFVICWTPDGPDGKDIGGTRTAIVLARHCNIPVFHLTDHNLQQIMDWVNHEHSKNQLVDQET